MSKEGQEDDDRDSFQSSQAKPERSFYLEVNGCLVLNALALVKLCFEKVWTYASLNVAFLNNTYIKCHNFSI